jgi:lysophospholipase L1-like esterase
MGRVLSYWICAFFWLASGQAWAGEIWAFFGDSNTEYGDYPAQVERALQSSGRDVRSINAGHGGETAASAHDQFFADLLETRPTLTSLFILFGLNDIDWGAEARPHVLAEYRGYYLDAVDEMTNAARAKGVRVFLLSYPPTEDPGTVTDAGMAAYVRNVGALSRSLDSPFLEWYRAALARNPDLIGLDVYTPMWTRLQELRAQHPDAKDPLLHEGDGGHLNAEGQKLLAETLEKLLTQPSYQK